MEKNNYFSKYINGLFDFFIIKYKVSEKTMVPTFDFKCKKSGDNICFYLTQEDIEKYDSEKILQGSLLKMDEHLKIYIRDNILERIIEHPPPYL